MPTSSPAAWFARLAPELAGHRSSHFQLGSDLRHLYSVRDTEATEAIVFYGARILEALVADALEAIRFPVSSSVFSNLTTLEQYCLLNKSALYSTNALRRLGNDARHIQSELTTADAELALALTEKVLEWFFLTMPGKPNIPRLCCDDGGVQLATNAILGAALDKAEELGQTWQLSWPQLHEQKPALLSVAQVPVIIAEIWIERDRIAEARELLHDALQEHQTELRLRQLSVLAASRAKDFSTARQQLDPLLKSKGDDEETLGIAGGLYKRMWNSDPSSNQWLEKSHRLYRKGWEKSQQNAYLGINAATTALFLGQPAEASCLGGQIAQLLSDRAARLRQSGCPEVRPDYWTQVSLAEALLLTGQRDQAYAAYRIAFEQYKKDCGNLDVTLNQLEMIAPKLDIPGTEIEPLLKHRCPDTQQS